jgi:hypothetical protein
MEDNSTTTTWWLWEANIKGCGIRIVVQVQTTIANAFRVDTPTSCFGECETGGEDLSWLGEHILIANAEFAKLRAEGKITPLSPAWAIEHHTQTEIPLEA